MHILFEKKVLYGFGQSLDAWYCVLSWNSPGLPCWWRAVESRLAWTATKLPPTPKTKQKMIRKKKNKHLPFITGWKTATPRSVWTAKSRIRPPALFKTKLKFNLFSN